MKLALAKYLNRKKKVQPILDALKILKGSEGANLVRNSVNDLILGNEALNESDEERDFNYLQKK